MCREAIESGEAYRRFRLNVELQGGDPDALEEELASRRAPVRKTLTAPAAGIVTSIDAYQVGIAGVYLGVGRNKTDDAVLPDVGVELVCKVGDSVGRGEPLCIVYAETDAAAEQAMPLLGGAYTVGDNPPQAQPLILDERAALEGRGGAGEAPGSNAGS
jgi:pyrimidine-nucleoside phosphorylase